MVDPLDVELVRTVREVSSHSASSTADARFDDASVVVLNLVPAILPTPDFISKTLDEATGQRNPEVFVNFTVVATPSHAVGISAAGRMVCDSEVTTDFWPASAWPVEFMKRTKVDLVGYAGPEGATASQSCLMDHLSIFDGLGMQVSHPKTPALIQTTNAHGKKVGLLSFSPFDGVSYTMKDLESARNVVSGASSQVDVLVVFFSAMDKVSKQHGSFVPTGEEFADDGTSLGSPRLFAHAVVDAGADVVFSTGLPVRGSEVYRGKVIYYSLGVNGGLHQSAGVYDAHHSMVARVVVSTKGNFIGAHLFTLGGDTMIPVKSSAIFGGYVDLDQRSKQEFPFSSGLFVPRNKMCSVRYVRCDRFVATRGGDDLVVEGGGDSSVVTTPVTNGPVGDENSEAGRESRSIASIFGDKNLKWTLVKDRTFGYQRATGVSFSAKQEAWFLGGEVCNNDARQTCDGLKKVDVFNFLSKTWTETHHAAPVSLGASVGAATIEPTQSILSQRQAVVIAGGQEVATGKLLDTITLSDLTGTSRTATLATARANAAVSSVGDLVIVAGGRTDSGVTNTIETFQAVPIVIGSSNSDDMIKPLTCTGLGQGLSVAREHASVLTTTVGESVYTVILGGTNNAYEPVDTVDVIRGTVSATPCGASSPTITSFPISSLPGASADTTVAAGWKSARFDYTGHNGAFVGGVRSDGTPTRDVIYFDMQFCNNVMSADCFRVVPNSLGSRRRHTTVTHLAGYVVAWGGDGLPFDDIEVLSLAPGTGSPVPVVVPPMRVQQVAERPLPELHSCSVGTSADGFTNVFVGCMNRESIPIKTAYFVEAGFVGAAATDSFRLGAGASALAAPSLVATLLAIAAALYF
jgi:hypothetical protein